MNNNQQNSSMIPTIVFILIIIIAGIYYFYSLGNSTPDSNSSLSSSNSIVNQKIITGTKILSLLNQVSVLKIDKTFFEGAAYKSLYDYAIEVPEQNIGRPNPFAPINGITQASSSSIGQGN